MSRTEVQFTKACADLHFAYEDYKRAWIDYLKMGYYSPVDGTFLQYGETEKLFARLKATARKVTEAEQALARIKAVE